MASIVMIQPKQCGYRTRQKPRNKRHGQPPERAMRMTVRESRFRPDSVPWEVWCKRYGKCDNRKNPAALA